ncbi:TRAUB-domain-containing protein [Plenodomus tracheiphilus IPT5]|uniref:Protein BFR2 n=1 Tax=Plenodomus tracheiphilus IPT5 TaxID=1408161 RepID=A0A6A7AYS1_9PLEO|nr:TRAUB-domain-containing protein [Plenodomus tracheiphilus IPT5]
MEKSKTRDFDPESLYDPAPSSSDDDRSDGDVSDVEDDQAGREHYAAVGKSKLRKPVEVALGPEYTGRGVSRKELEESDSDDPFAGFEEIDSEAGDDGDVEGLDGLQINGAESSEEGSDAELDEEMSDDDDDMEGASANSDSDGSAPDDDDEDEDDASEEEDTARKSTVRDMLKDSKSFTSTIAASAQSDVAKGQAVKTQRKNFDTLLNTRIRLQKALISTNSMFAEPHKTEAAPDASIEAAETAALTLLNNLTDLRLSLEENRTGTKRKRPTFDSATPSSEIWSQIRTSDSYTQPHRKAVLERWSNKTKATTTTNNKARLNASAQQTLTEVLDSQLTSSHLVARTHQPRSCAPLQSSVKGALPDDNIYDDADFYGLMLKELLEQRSADLNANGAAEFVVQAPWQVARDAKTKKVVDTKASKGRRLRYTVQEKLQNFMAPEERGEWGDRQRDELFSSLFGQRLGLGEHDDVENAVEDEVDAEEAGLMLFRS